MKLRVLILPFAFAVVPIARGGAVYVMAESYTPGYSALDMDIDMSVEDSFSNPYFSQIQQDSATYTASWYFTRTRIGVHQVDVTTGANILSFDVRSTAGAVDGIAFAVPLYVRYNYNVALRNNTFVYAGVLAGGEASNRTVDVNVPGTLRAHGSSNAFAGMCGVGVGLKYFGERWGVDMGYDFRLMGTSSATFDTGGDLHSTVKYTTEQIVSIRLIVHF